MHENLNALLIRKYADMIAQARLKVTATYDDGTTETKTYVITPVDNLEETLRAYGEALRAQAAGRGGEPRPDRAHSPSAAVQVHANRLTRTPLPSRRTCKGVRVLNNTANGWRHFCAARRARCGFLLE